MARSAADVQGEAARLGFLASGIAHLGSSERGDALDAWLARGLAGTMRYLHRQAKKRKQPALIVKGARVAVVVLENYLAPVAVLGRPRACGSRCRPGLSHPGIRGEA